MSVIMVVATLNGCFYRLWLLIVRSLQEAPYYLGSVVGPLIFGETPIFTLHYMPYRIYFTYHICLGISHTPCTTYHILYALHQILSTMLRPLIFGKLPQQTMAYVETHILCIPPSSGPL